MYGGSAQAKASEADGKDKDKDRKSDKEESKAREAPKPPKQQQQQQAQTATKVKGKEAGAGGNQQTPPPAKQAGAQQPTARAAPSTAPASEPPRGLSPSISSEHQKSGLKFLSSSSISAPSPSASASSTSSLSGVKSPLVPPRVVVAPSSSSSSPESTSTGVSPGGSVKRVSFSPTHFDSDVVADGNIDGNIGDKWKTKPVGNGASSSSSSSSASKATPPPPFKPRVINNKDGAQKQVGRNMYEDLLNSDPSSDPSDDVVVVVAAAAVPSAKTSETPPRSAPAAPPSSGQGVKSSGKKSKSKARLSSSDDPFALPSAGKRGFFAQAMSPENRLYSLSLFVFFVSTLLMYLGGYHQSSVKPVPIIPSTASLAKFSSGDEKKSLGLSGAKNSATSLLSESQSKSGGPPSSEFADPTFIDVQLTSPASGSVMTASTFRLAWRMEGRAIQSGASMKITTVMDGNALNAYDITLPPDASTEQVVSGGVDLILPGAGHGFRGTHNITVECAMTGNGARGSGSSVFLYMPSLENGAQAGIARDREKSMKAALDLKKAAIRLTQPNNGEFLVGDAVILKFQTIGFSVFNVTHMSAVDVLMTLDNGKPYHLNNDVNTLTGLSLGKHDVEISVVTKETNEVVCFHAVQFWNVRTQEDAKNRITRHQKTGKDAYANWLAATRPKRDKQITVEGKPLSALSTNFLLGLIDDESIAVNLRLEILEEVDGRFEQ